MSTTINSGISEELLGQFSTFLSEKIGLYYPKERWGDLEKKMQPVMLALGFENVADCMRWLISEPLEQDKIGVLAFHLTIGETYFFRDSRLFSILEKDVLPDILERHQLDRRIRIWSAGCCTGEEPYSIAILLHRLIPDLKQWKIQIVGTDINGEFIKRAKQGRYKKWSFRSTSDEIFNRYFQGNKEGSYTLTSDIRRMVNFEYLNLAENNFIEGHWGLADADLILCNNVLIYFNQKQIAKTIHQFANALVDKGWLIVSSIEVPFVEDPSLSKRHFPGAILFKKQPPEKIRSNLEFKNPPSLAKKAATNEKNKAALNKLIPLDQKKLEKSIETRVKGNKSPLKECLKLNAQKNYSDAISNLLNYLNEQEKKGVFPLSCIPEIQLLIRTYANQGNFSSALQWCKKAFITDKLDPVLYYLLATIQMGQDERSEAMVSLRRAIFLDPKFVVAYHMLGVLEEQMGNHKAALRNYEAALENLDGYGNEDVLPGTENTTASHLKDSLAHHLGRQ